MKCAHRATTTTSTGRGLNFQGSVWRRLVLVLVLGWAGLAMGAALRNVGPAARPGSLNPPGIGPGDSGLWMARAGNEPKQSFHNHGEGPC